MDILEWWALLPREGLKGSSVGGSGVALWCLFREKMEDFPLGAVRGALLEDIEVPGWGKDRSSGDGGEGEVGNSG